MKDWFKARNIWGAAIMSLSDAEAGRLAKALWSYTMTGEQQNLSGAEKGIFALIQLTLSQDDERESEISEKRAIAGAIGAKQKQAKQANASFAIDDEANLANASNKNKNKNKNKSKSKSKNKEIDNMFARFWSIYPRKTAKQAAQKEFEKLNPDEALLQQMIIAVTKQRQSAQWQEAGGQYIPYPSTWLHQHRWEDEVQQSKITPIKTVAAQQYEQRDYDNVQDEIKDEMESMMADFLKKGS